MTTYSINWHELWGNAEDGFNCNNVHHIALIDSDFDPEAEWTEEIAEQAKDLDIAIATEFLGRSIALDENTSHTISKITEIDVSWNDVDSAEVFHFQTGACIGSVYAE